MTIVPPENSTLFAIPGPNQMYQTPLRMMIHDSAIACHFQRTKSKFGFLNMCIKKLLLDADGRRLPLRELPLEDRLRDEDRREQIHGEAEHQRRRETSDRPGAELKEERGGDERRDVRVEQREEHAAEARVDRRANAALRRELFLDPFEDEHVRVD